MNLHILESIGAANRLALHGSRADFMHLGL